MRGRGDDDGDGMRLRSLLEDLHPADVANLLECFDRLLAAGHSLIVIEHDLDVIGSADFIIDLGPDSGKAGGRVVATGTPEEVAQVAESRTGQVIGVR